MDIDVIKSPYGTSITIKERNQYFTILLSESDVASLIEKLQNKAIVVKKAEPIPDKYQKLIDKAIQKERKKNSWWGSIWSNTLSNMN